MTQTSTPVFPPGRYGRRREPGRARRWVTWLLLVPVVVAAGWLAVLLDHKYGDAGYQATVTGYGEVTDTQVTVRLHVYKDAAGPAVCRLQAKDRSMAEVGYAEVTVPAGRDVDATYHLATTRRAYGVAVLGCRWA